MALMQHKISGLNAKCILLKQRKGAGVFDECPSVCFVSLHVAALLTSWVLMQ